MKNAIILHGLPDKQEYYDLTVPSSSNYHWLPWLQKQLLAHDIAAQTPEIPGAYKPTPHYETWVREFERFDLGPPTLLVGHSCGGGFLVRYLSEHKVRVGKVVLVAPWLDPDREYDTARFFDFEVDPSLVSLTAGLTIFHSDNDMETIQKTVRILREKLPGHTYREFHKYGHFCIDDMPAEFPELLDELLS